MRKLLRAPDPVEGDSLPEPPAEPVAAPAPPPPPLAAAVLDGSRSEASVGEDLDKKKLQTRIAELEDDRRRLLEAQAQQPQPPPAPHSPAVKQHWLNGGSIFD